MKALSDLVRHFPKRLTVVEGDALEANPQNYLGAGPTRIVANLPYNIATALLIRWLSIETWPPWYDSLVLMFQREVAERIASQAGDDNYGRLGVLTAAPVLYSGPWTLIRPCRKMHR